MQEPAECQLLAASALRAMRSALLLLSEALAPCWLVPGGALQLVPDWPAALGTLCTAAAALAAAEAVEADTAGGGASSRQAAAEVWERCEDLMSAYTAACILSPDPQLPTALQRWLSVAPEQLGAATHSGRQLGQQAEAASTAVLAEACLAACQSCLLLADAPASGGDKARMAAAAAEVACGPGAAAPLAAAGRSSPGEGFSSLQLLLMQATAAAQRAEPVPAPLASLVERLQPALVAAAVAPADSAAANGGSSSNWLQQETVARAFGGLAGMLRMLCVAHPAADALHSQQQQEEGRSATARLGALLQRASQLLLAEAAADGSPRLLAFLGAACHLTHHIRPAPSPTHFASLLALLLRLLRPAAGPSAAAALDPVRHTFPFTSLFPAASACQPLASAPGCDTAAAAALARDRRAALDALRVLLDGCTTQQLTQALRFAERALPASLSAHSAQGAQHSTAGAAAAAGAAAVTRALPVAELTLMALEASSSGRVGRVLGQHSDRLAGVLTEYVASAAAAASDHAPAAVAPAAVPAAEAQSLLPAMQPLLQALLAAGSPASGEEQQQPQPAPLAVSAGPSLHPQSQRSQLDEVAALCTVLRALESLAARPRVFALSARQVSNILHSVAATWAGRRAFLPGGLAVGGSSGSGSHEPAAGAGGVRSVATGAALFTGSCALLLAILRHRQQVGLICCAMGFVGWGRCLGLLALSVLAATCAGWCALPSWARGGAANWSKADTILRCAACLPAPAGAGLLPAAAAAGSARPAGLAGGRRGGRQAGAWRGGRRASVAGQVWGGSGASDDRGRHTEGECCGGIWGGFQQQHALWPRLWSHRTLACALSAA